jgi:hypothetical protein
MLPSSCLLPDRSSIDRRVNVEMLGAIVPSNLLALKSSSCKFLSDTISAGKLPDALTFSKTTLLIRGAQRSFTRVLRIALDGLSLWMSAQHSSVGYSGRYMRFPHLAVGESSLVTQYGSSQSLHENSLPEPTGMEHGPSYLPAAISQFVADT